MKPFVSVAALLLAAQGSFAASGMFPKMSAATNVNVFDVQKDGTHARASAFALQGLINQHSAEVYLEALPLANEQLALSHRPQFRPSPLPKGNSGLRTLFRQYQNRVSKMIIYDPAKDWTWTVALMAAAQQNAIPVIDGLRSDLMSEFNWNGPVEDYRNRWTNRIEAYEWALAHLKPQCSTNVVFALQYGRPLVDYVVASRGFVFSLDKQDPRERALIEKIFRHYTVGTSLMGYAWDSMNEIANRFGVGYVVSDFYGNGSFWSSFPNSTFQQSPGRAVQARPGKVYVTLTWSDGDNVQIDQNALYYLWQDPARGKVPVGTTMSPALQELNPPLLRWFYTNMTTNDELLAGPSGFQFIYGDCFADNLFAHWCALNRTWLDDAGFCTASLWRTPYPGRKFSIYVNSSSLTGIFRPGNEAIVRYDTGTPVLDEGGGAQNEEDLFERVSQLSPNEKAPVFAGVKCLVPGFQKGGRGYSAIQRQTDRLNVAYPARFVFLLPKDLFATARAHYRLPPSRAGF